jgi:hypothetical protein
VDRLPADNGDARALAKLWDEINASDTLRVKLHEERDGKRVYGARKYKRRDPNYAEGAHLKLLSEGYEAEEVR